MMPLYRFNNRLVCQACILLRIKHGGTGNGVVDTTRFAAQYILKAGRVLAEVVKKPSKLRLAALTCFLAEECGKLADLAQMLFV